MQIRSININAGGGYTVSAGGGLLKDCGDRLRQSVGLRKMAVITDTTVEKLYLDTVIDSLSRAGFETCAYVMPAGERSKNIETLSGILEFMADSGLTRSDCVAALGGGVVGDIAGFAAGCFMRGIRYVQLPTTLLAAVDSSVGGKTAIDLRAGKNLAGLFLQPSAVLCDTDCLATLAPEVLADGMAEAVKTGVLAGGPLMELLEHGELTGEKLPELIESCVAFKGAVVQADEREAGPRKLLNLGHTIGHAIEKCSEYSISHGHAVAIGMAIIARAAEALGWSAEPCAERIKNALARHALPVSAEFMPSELARAAQADKKRAGGEITLVIPRGIGDCVLKAVPVSHLESIIQAGMEVAG